MNSQELRLLPHSLNSCTSIAHLKQLHAVAIKTPSLSLHNQLLFPKLISLSSSSPDLFYIRSILLTSSADAQFRLNLCNAFIHRISANSSGESTNSTDLRAMEFLREMLLIGVQPDGFTLPHVLKALARIQRIREGQQIHAHSIKIGLVRFNVYVCNTLMRLYSVCGSIDAVQKLFGECPHRDLVSWTTLIQAFTKAGLYRKAVGAFMEMCDLKLRVDGRTLVVVLSAFSNLGDLNLGRKVHAYIHHYIDVNADVFVGNALLDMYLKCDDSNSAYKVFDEMPVRNVVTWNAMISGLAYQGRYKEALDMFRRMQRTGPKPDEVTLVGVLNSCANLGVLELGKWVHAYMRRNHILADKFVGNALLDMYAKCGRIDEAFRVFESMKRRDVYSYTAMIVGLALHGEANWAFQVFSRMLREGVEPNEVTFLGLLMACSHSGLVSDGKKYFFDMLNTYKLRPQAEHYGCMIDLLGRAGLVKEAEEIIHSMEIRPDAFAWGALLGACRIHGNVNLGESVMQKLMNLDPGEDGNYILMTNLYSSAHRWKDALKLRKKMKSKKMRKTPGCSLIEVDGVVHEFRKGDKSHPKNRVIYSVLEGIACHLKSYGTVEHSTFSW
ncbi:pentatricopeptide repeat-containing protein At1g08070, chloroplastic-like isoform X1 [Cucurbita pepo subsp. pepo]|uniref:pentatricopeptide repeat-containing protein At1g08070, chloroplastic-like isoform X1 n=2 Tax=Cucurbita pepo subsp. pepo TaxID=3664 RepID=UPI000C9D9755|nr:pentatricopeptide repeat-containing protein At1g08070, chloroplastic-like isoform X1 [Cucurbita pepo subsp. pepo]